MKKNNILQSVKIIVLAFVLGIAVSYISAMTPTQPTGNVSGPLNVGPSNQIKQAGLSLGNTTGIFPIYGDTTPMLDVKGGDTDVENLLSWGDYGYFNGYIFSEKLTPDVPDHYYSKSNPVCADDGGKLVLCTTQPTNCAISDFAGYPSTLSTSDNTISFTWSTSGGTSGNITQTDASPFYTIPNGNLNSGSYSYTLTAGDKAAIAAGNDLIFDLHIDGCTKEIVIHAQQPTACTITSFTASPASITSGGSSTLAWSTSNCKLLSLTASTGGLTGSQPVNGTFSVSPTVTTTYTITATNGSGSTKTSTATVTVNQPTSACKITSFTASPTSIESGSSSTLAWTTTNCTSYVDIDSGPLLLQNGSQSVSPTVTKTYTLYAGDGINPQQKATVTVTVNSVPVCSITSFTVTDINTDTPGVVKPLDPLKLTWKTSNCVNASWLLDTFDGGSGLPVVISSGQVASGSDSSSAKTRRFGGGTSFTLTADDGRGNTATKQAVIDTSPCNIDSLTASTEPGSATPGVFHLRDEVVLSWKTTGWCPQQGQGNGVFLTRVPDSWGFGTLDLSSFVKSGISVAGSYDGAQNNNTTKVSFSTDFTLTSYNENNVINSSSKTVHVDVVQ